MSNTLLLGFTAISWIKLAEEFFGFVILTGKKEMS